MIQLAVCLGLYIAVLIGSRYYLDRIARPSSLDPQIGLRLFLLFLALIPLAAAVFVMMSAGRLVGGILILVLGIPFGVVAAPFIWETLAHLMGWIAMGAPSERSMKARKSFDRAKAFVHKQEFEAAVAEYRAELAKDPSQAHGYRELADVLEKLGRDDEAIVELETALPLTEDVEERALAQLRVVDLHARRGRMDRARDLLAQMESESWPQRIAKAIQTRRQRLSP